MPEKKENQLLRNPDILPTAENIAEGLGKANKAFIQFINGLKTHGVTLMVWRYYNDGKAWLSKGEYKWKTTRGTDKVKPIFWLSVWEGFFRVSFFFAYDFQNEMFSLPISQETKENIKNANPMGKSMRFMPVILDITNEEQLHDVYQFVQLRKK